jgi:hypothetical protein
MAGDGAMGVPAVTLVDAAAAVFAVPNAQPHSLIMRRAHNGIVMRSHSYPRIRSSIRYCARALLLVLCGDALLCTRLLSRNKIQYHQHTQYRRRTRLLVCLWVRCVRRRVCA